VGKKVRLGRKCFPNSYSTKLKISTSLFFSVPFEIFFLGDKNVTIDICSVQETV
jgi:hypothetical protein